MVRTRKQREAAPTPDKATKAPEEAPKQKKTAKGGLASYLNSSTLATCAAVAYVAFAYRNFSRVLDPLANLPEDYKGGVQVTPMWPENSTLDVEVALSTYASLPHDFMRNASLYDDSTVIIWREQNIELNTHTKDRKIDLRLCASENALQCSDEALAAAERAAQPGVLSRLILGEESSGPRQRIILPPKAWAQLQANGTLYLHSAVTRITEKARWRGLADNDVRRTARVPSIALVKFEAAPKGRAALAKRKLLYDVHPTLGSLGPPAPWAPTYTGEEGEMCAKWKPEAAVRVVAEFRDWPADVSVPGMQRFRDRAPGGAVVYKYAPPTYADEIGLTSDKYLVVNSTVDALPLSLNFQPLSFARWQLIARMEEGLKAQQEDFGFSENDIDEVRRLIADTKTWLLAVTMLASVLHLLFEFLAFKSDVDFWKNNKSLRGLSARSVVVDLISQIVVLAYLVDQGSSLLVSIPAAGAILIQCWKVEKATGVRPDFSRPFPWIRCERLEAVALSAKNAKADDKGAQLDAATLRVDRLATLYLSLSLGPLVVGYAVKTLIYDAHLGWYSWGLGAMTNAVYTGGFILMTPQLALNYHLKSVSHLPWRLLCFRFVNTFIDDLFAFVIKMPVMHRVSCFRDDVVFLIYLYQRRIYSVDMSRGVAGEDAAQ